MRNVVATILILMLTGCVGKQSNHQAEEIKQGDLPRPLATEQIPVRDVLPAPVAAAASEKQREPRAEVVSLPDTEVDSTASNNASQQSASGLANVQIAKIAESVDASLLRVESKIVTQNEMVATLQNTMSAQATAIATLKADVSANAQAGIGNSQSATTAGRDAVTQFSDGMERFMTRMLDVVEFMASAIKWIIGGAVVSCVGALVTIVKVFVGLIRALERSKSKDEEGDRQLLKDVISERKAIVDGLSKGVTQ